MMITSSATRWDQGVSPLRSIIVSDMSKTSYPLRSRLPCTQTDFTYTITVKTIKITDTSNDAKSVGTTLILG